MPIRRPNIRATRDRSQWVRLRTLVILRWIAIAGQIGAVLIADRVLDLSFREEICYLVIGISVLANIIASFLFPENKRLNESQVTAILSFDIAQLCLLIFLTGGLHNPFALLVLAPVAVGAAALSLSAIFALGAFAIGLIVLVSLYHEPLRTAQGFLIQNPATIELGFLIAIVTGVVFVATLIRSVSQESHLMSDALTATQLALSREQKLTDLGGVVAAAAHELGTPLATIKLAASELAEDLEEGTPMHDDAVLIREQADRCRDILRSMGRAGNDDLHMHSAPLSAVVEEAAEPHIDRGKSVHFSAAPEAGADPSQPIVTRAPEIMHGLRNLVQNAVDFADSTVWVDLRWTDDRLAVTITDDGNGYPTYLIGRIGDPSMSRLNRRTDRREGYEGMGLGLFIAKTLLERSGAELTFANGADPFLTDAERPIRKGAIVAVVWNRPDVTPAGPEVGENRPLMR